MFKISKMEPRKLNNERGLKYAVNSNAFVQISLLYFEIFGFTRVREQSEYT
jgi:hypothetical protein